MLSQIKLPTYIASWLIQNGALHPVDFQEQNNENSGIYYIANLGIE